MVILGGFMSHLHDNCTDKKAVTARTVALINVNVQCADFMIRANVAKDN